MDSTERALLVKGVTGALEEPDARAGLARFGWPELLEADALDGISVLFRLQGRLLTPSSALDDVLNRAAAMPLGDPRVWVLPVAGPVPASRLGPGLLTVDGLVQVCDATATIVVPVAGGEGTVAVWELEGLRGTAAPTPTDPTAGWARLHATAPADRATLRAEVNWPAVVAAGRQALAYELIGIVERMLAMTIEHVTTRHQFGRPLGSLQVVKHKLADVHVWLEAARLAADASWETTDPTAAALAKLLACRAARTARENCQQLLGGMGPTWEHDFHRYLRRALVLEPLLGGGAVLRAELGELLRTGRAPHAASL